LSGEPPTQYENYPYSTEPTNPPSPNPWREPPAPVPLVVRPYQPTGGAASTPGRPSRRGLLAGVVGVAALGGILIAAGGGALSFTTGSEEDPESWATEDPFDDSADEPLDDTVFGFGDLTFDVPDGWQVDGYTPARVLLSRGRNQLLAVIYDDATGSASEELATALSRSNTEFSGPTGKVKKTYSNTIERATATATGTYEGKAARQIVDLLLESGTDEPRALFVRQILTAAEGSKIAGQSARLFADLRDGWPW
jgi:hypothetical protein